MRRLSALFLLLLILAPAAGATEIGFRQIEIADARRPLHVTLWYPTQDAGPLAEVGFNPAFEGLTVVRDAEPASGDRPLVLLSHGMGGSWRNLSWLAGELVRQGFAVAAPDHPGTTSFDRRREEAARLSERPRDVRRVLDAVLADPALLGHVNSKRIAVIGHSLGGWTAMALAGARFDIGAYDRQCGAVGSIKICGALEALGVLGNRDEATKLADDMSDPRISAFVALDPGAMQGFTPASLQAIDAPILLMTADTETREVAASIADATHIAPYLDPVRSRHVAVSEATHFSFVQLCKPGAEALIEEESPGESFVCRDGGRRTQAEIHRQVADEVMGFLATSLPAE